MNLSNKKSNSLYTKEECPECHSVFMGGFDSNNIKKCPMCKKIFRSGQMIDHGDGCSICKDRHRGAHNIYKKDGCPALMSDGRFITNHGSTRDLTDAMRKLNGFRDPNQFRTFMQKYGDQFMNSERNDILRKNTCNPTMSCCEGWYNSRMKNNL